MAIQTYSDGSIAHWITVGELRELLESDKLKDTDELLVNDLKNFIILRDEKWLGWIDLAYYVKAEERINLDD